MEETACKEINDRIWITARTRMVSERKARRYQDFSFFFVTYYSVNTVILSIFAEFYRSKFPALDQLIVASSVVVLAASLMAAGFGFGARAATFRDCYLRLQSLCDETMDCQEKKKRYREILTYYPNHSSWDYEDMVVRHILLDRKKLRIGEDPIYCTFPIVLFVAFRCVVFWSLFLIFLLAPLVFLIRPLFT